MFPIVNFKETPLTHSVFTTCKTVIWCVMILNPSHDNISLNIARFKVAWQDNRGKAGVRCFQLCS